MTQSDENIVVEGKDSGEQSDDAPTIEQLLTASNWEERVASARLKREQSMAQKESIGFDDDDDELPSAITNSFANKPRPWDAQEAISRQWAGEDDLPDTLPDQHLDEQRRAKGAAWVLLACCATLGFGVTLVIGILIGMGVLGIVQPVEIAARNAQPDIATVAPAAIVVAPAEAAPAKAPAPVAVTVPTIPEVPLTAQLEKFGADIWMGPKDGPIMRHVSAPVQSTELEDPLVNLANAGAFVQDATPHGISISSYRSDNLPFLQTAFSAVSAVDTVGRLAAPSATETPSFRAPAPSGGLSPIVLASALPPTVAELQALTPRFDVSAQRVETFVTVPSMSQPDQAPRTPLQLASNDPVSDIPLIKTIFQPGIAIAPPAAHTQPPQPLTLASKLGLVLQAPDATKGKTALANSAHLRLASSDPVPDIPLIKAVFQPGVVTRTPALRTQPPEPLTLSAKLGLFGVETQNLNLVLHAPDAMEQAAIDGHTKTIESSGFGLSKIVRPGFKVSASHLRFYNSSDRKVAQALAAEMGFELRDFTATSAPKGLVEVWLEGTSVAKAPVRKARPKTVRRQARQTQRRRVDPVRRLRNELANRLRNGDHL